MHHSFDISIAEKYGVNIAIFLNNMAYWVKHNMANDRHFYDGRYWTYNSVRAYSTHFPYWSDKQVRTIIEHCISHGLIVKGNYNEHKYDQTQWYGFTDLGHKLLNLTILPNGQMDSTERANGFDQKGKPIPDNKPDYKPYNKSSCALRNLESKAPAKEKASSKKPSPPNEAKHDWAAMMNEKASIERNNKFKRALPPPELAALIKTIKGKAMFG